MQEYMEEGILTRNVDIRKNAEGYNDPTPYHAITNVEQPESTVHTYPRRGNVYDLEGKMALVVSVNEINERSESVNIVFVFPCSIAHPLPTHAEIGCGSVRCEKIASYKKNKIGPCIFKLTDVEMADVEDALRMSLDLPRCDHHAMEVASSIALKKPIEKAPENDKHFAMTVERNMYRKLYEQLLDRVMEGKAQ